MRIDVVDAFRVHAGVAQRIPHAAERAVAILRRSRDVKGVGRYAVTSQLAGFAGSFEGACNRVV